MTSLGTSVGQLLWVGFDGTILPAELEERIAQGQVGAGILFRRNVTDLDQVIALNAALHAAARAGAPLLVAVDQEGGRVQRVRAPATVWPAMAVLGARAACEEDGGVALAESVGRAVANELSALGFDLNFAPVLDTHTNPDNPVIGDRSFATDAAQVARLAAAFARGSLAAGVIPCGKHFPGHGDTNLDSHLALPRLDHSMSRLESIELLPFRSNLDLPVLMTAHVIFSALDASVPATLSPRVVTGLLRETLGYRGLIVSDDMEMKAIADHFGAEDAAERAILAGCNALLLCHDAALQRSVFEHLVRRAEKSSALAERVSDSAARVAALKARPRVERAERSVIGSASHRALAESLVQDA